MRKPAGPSFAVEALQLHSFDFIARAVGFWAHRMRLVPCPTCAIVGSLDVDIRSYGVRFDCDNCDFQYLQVFEGDDSKRRRATDT